MRFLLFCFFACIGFNMEAQVGINTTSPQAQLDIRSSNQATPSNTDGILIPKIDAFPATNPTAAQTGMLVYLTTISGANQPGFYYWDNASVSWIALKGTSDADWYEVGGTTAPNNINDSMYHIGNVAIGKNTANYPLEVDSNNAQIGVNSEMTATSSLTDRKGIQNVVSGTSNDLIYGLYNQVRNSGTGIHYGNYSLMSGINSSEKYGTYNRVINGSGSKFGSYNYISGGGNSLYGNYNFIENGSSFFQYGTFNQISNINDTYKIGVNNGISGAGNSSHIGVANSLSGTGIGEQVGVENQILNNGNGFQYGVRNLFSNTSTGEKRGLTTTFSNTQGDDYGIEHTFNSTGTAGNQYGMRNLFFGNKSGTLYGIRNDFNGSGGVARIGLFNHISGNSAERVGVENLITGFGTGESKGTFTILAGSSSGAMYGHDVFFDYLDCGSGNKYGYSVNIPLVTCGVHYGIYSNVEKSNSFAGYFLGRVSIGTSVVNSNYILPLSRGTNGQIMQTDGTGNVTWRNPVAVLNNVAWTISGNSGTNPSFNFLGTSDDVDLVFKRNGVASGRISQFSTSFGYESLFNNTGIANTAFGSRALFANTVGNLNTAIGIGTLEDNTAASNNIAIGNRALTNQNFNNGNVSFVSNNVAVGFEALLNNNPTSTFNGVNNTAIGSGSSVANTIGFRNTAVGRNALNGNTTGNYNTAVGSFSYSTGTFTNSMALGDGVVISASNQVRIGDVGVTSIGGFANWTNVSDGRFKTNVQQNVPGLAFIKKLNPITYTLDLNAIHKLLKTPSDVRKPETETDKIQEIQTGFIAQEVEQAAKESGFEFSGVDKPKNEADFYGLRYAEFVVPLVKAVQEQQEIIEKMQLKIQELEVKITTLNRN